MSALLELRDLNVHYGAIHALRGISFQVGEGEIVTLIGANGAGKTTTLRAVSGLLRASGGIIEYRGEKTAGLKPHKLVERGLSHAPEGRALDASPAARLPCRGRMSTPWLPTQPRSEGPRRDRPPQNGRSGSGR